MNEKIYNYQKFSPRDKAQKNKETETRKILINTLDGNTYKSELFTIMASVISSGAKVIFRADWNIPTRVVGVLDVLEY